MTLQDASQQLLFQLYHLYDTREAANIADIVLEHLTGWKKIDRVVNKKLPLSAPVIGQFEKTLARLSRNEPVQYVLNEAWFAGLKLYVDENVLVPRPETEELADWVINDLKKNSAQTPSVADMGTGSGCIAIAIKKALPGTRVSAFDVSDGALRVAAKNAELLDAVVDILKMDLLHDDQFDLVPLCDVIVSNPPYIPAGHRGQMNLNVVSFEPHLALFVPDDDPLLFYRQLAKLALEKLKPNGALYAEMHERHADETAMLFKKQGLQNVEIRKDLQGKPRMIRASG